MEEKNKLVPTGRVPRQESDDQPIIEPEVVKAEVVETDDVEKEGQESRRSAGWKTEFQRWFGVPPFPLSAEKLAFLVQRIDWVGPHLLGAF